MESSILKTTKKILNIPTEYTAFDLDIMTHINGVFLTLNQLGIGPVEGFVIEDEDATWESFLGNNPLLSAVKTYVYMKVRLIFDPPPTSFHVDAAQNLIKETEWRLNLVAESDLS